MPQARPSTLSPVGMGTGTGPASSPLVRVITPEEVTRTERDSISERVQAEDEARSLDPQEVSSLAAFVRHRYHFFRTERQSRGIDSALLHSLRTFRGQYNPTILKEIQKFGGSTAYSRLTAGKCRGASSLLREVYLGAERPWLIEPTPDPELPSDIDEAIQSLLASEQAELSMMGHVIPSDVLLGRERDLIIQGKKRSIEIAKQSARMAGARIEDILVEGGFYNALKDVLQDLPIFPYAVLKGPVVRRRVDVKWGANGRPEVRSVPKMCWERVSPFDFFWSPGASDPEQAEVIERWKVSRAELNACRGVPGYFEESLVKALDAYGLSGLSDWINESDTERAWIERKEDPQETRSGLIDAVEYHGAVQGRMLVDSGVPLEQFLPEGHAFDPLADYMVQVILVGAYVIKVTANPDPLKRHPYYVTSYEKVPGAVAGHGLPEILATEETWANATVRSLINNMAISSGPQVVVNTERLDPAIDEIDLYPWKRWLVVNDTIGRGSGSPVEFFQPSSNAQELLAVYNAVVSMADENSALPRYQTGGSKASGAARTASGLAQLTAASNRVLMQVSSNIDLDIIEPALRKLYDMIMLTQREPFLRGDEEIAVVGATRMAQKETERMRQLELLQMTSNPVDRQILGQEGRAALLRQISQNVGLVGRDIVPSRDEIRLQQQCQPQPVPPASSPNPSPLPPAGGDRPGAETDNMHRVNP